MIELECLPYGVGHQNEGVCLLVRMGPHRVLLDCGIDSIEAIVSSSNGKQPADVVLCTHAHPDHARGLLALHNAFPELPIYASEVTTRLLPLNWLNEPEKPRFCQALPWRSSVELQEGLSVALWPAGHLPGAAALLLTYKAPRRDYKIFYTGDFLLSSSRLVEGLPLEELRGLKPDVLIVEGSYGTARHPHRRQQENQLAERIYRAIETQRSVLLPTPTLGLGQEILMLLRSHHHFTGRDLDIWVDDSVADGCDAYLDLLPCLPSTVQNFARHQPLFWDDRIRPRVRRFSESSDRRYPCIIITHKAANLSRYCRADTGDWLLLSEQPRRPLLNLKDDLEISAAATLQTQIRAGRIKMDTYLLSEHCDGAGTTQLIHNLRPQHVVFVHGTPEYLADLTGLEELQNRYHLHSPASGTLVELPIGETFLQPAPPDTRYEGELTELKAMITVTLPDAIAADSRWQAFADTGLVEARWQGEEIVLRGMSQRELLDQGIESLMTAELECCNHCNYYRNQRCWSQASPLFGFKVSPEGYCPAFEASSSIAQDPPESKETP